jgi:large subunit ribosomal protein L4
MPSVQIINIEGKEVGTAELAAEVFGAEVHEHLLWETVKWQLARRRRGTHSVKRRGEIVGTTKKSHKQKGTGRARAGSGKAPHWVGGGSAFGPRPRDYSYSMPKKARKKALCAALSLRVNESKLVVIDNFPVAGGKTRKVVEALTAIGAGGALIVDSLENGDLVRGSRNLATSKVVPPEGLNVYDVLNHKHLVVTADAVKQIEDALK